MGSGLGSPPRPPAQPERMLDAVRVSLNRNRAVFPAHWFWVYFASRFPTVEHAVRNAGLPSAPGLAAVFLGAMGLCPWTRRFPSPVHAVREQNKPSRRGQDQPRDGAGSTDEAVPNSGGAGTIPVGKAKIGAAFSGVAGDAAGVEPSPRSRAARGEVFLWGFRRGKI